MEDVVCEILNRADDLYKAKALPEGTIREYSGRKYQKQGGKWLPYSEGAKESKKEDSRNEKKQLSKDDKSNKRDKDNFEFKSKHSGYIKNIDSLFKDALSYFEDSKEDMDEDEYLNEVATAIMNDSGFYGTISDLEDSGKNDKLLDKMESASDELFEDVKKYVDKKINNNKDSSNDNKIPYKFRYRGKKQTMSDLEDIGFTNLSPGVGNDILGSYKGNHYIIEYSGLINSNSKDEDIIDSDKQGLHNGLRDITVFTDKYHTETKKVPKNNPIYKEIQSKLKELTSSKFSFNKDGKVKKSKEKDMSDELIKSNHKLWPTVTTYDDREFSTKFDENVQKSLKKEEERLEKSTKLELTEVLKKSETSKDVADLVEFKTNPFADMSKNDVIRAIWVNQQFKDKEDTLFD